ncbi:surface polysaccharide O-acyltransferase-like enzyme [Mucilaginibacter gracilis]|uniref:Surface polysaccharide O-acyltransferase-like enzyme n=1 Tax=Mucilaginibacter gracilis TaxID=423350 RepID=A0A495JAX1_9SPHI|nr:acyltransferase family protein [Mucilaginibacter gracilis]RKR85502.1 surface polysaccharide O-acyltransferase-like enzyme [Mucilaginibacter gracilis]
MTAIKKENLDWINNLRIIALFAVIILHTTSPVLETYNKGPLNIWMVGNFYNSLVRFAVPVFVMISGALLLHRDYEIGDFLKKRLVRIVIPFLFWSLIYIAYEYYNEDIAYTGNVGETLHQVLHFLKYGSSYHLWYVYMLIGLYLFVPIIGKFVRNATQNELLYFLIMWFVVMLLGQPYLSRFKPQIDLRYFEGFVGYLVLGHYLAFKPLPKKRIGLWAAVFLATLLLIFGGTYLLFKHYNGISTLLYEPLSPSILLIASSVFMLGRLYTPKVPQFIITTRDFLGRYNYGIYLSHALVLSILSDNDVNYTLFNPMISIPCIAVVCLALSVLLVFIINKIPLGKYISG